VDVRLLNTTAALTRIGGWVSERLRIYLEKTSWTDRGPWVDAVVAPPVGYPPIRDRLEDS
jgi:hypothetical protein